MDHPHTCVSGTNCPPDVDLCCRADPTVNRDPLASPEEQTKQLLSIYPVVDGQKLNSDLTIPPRKEANGEPEKANNAEAGDLIDIGGGDAPAASKEPSVIENMLNSTGKPADGPLIDFADTMKKDLPTTEEKS